MTFFPISDKRVYEEKTRRTKKHTPTTHMTKTKQKKKQQRTKQKTTTSKVAKILYHKYKYVVSDQIHDH